MIKTNKMETHHFQYDVLVWGLQDIPPMFCILSQGPIVQVCEHLKKMNLVQLIDVPLYYRRYNTTFRGRWVLCLVDNNKLTQEIWDEL